MIVKKFYLDCCVFSLPCCRLFTVLGKLLHLIVWVFKVCWKHFHVKDDMKQSLGNFDEFYLIVQHAVRRAWSVGSVDNSKSEKRTSNNWTTKIEKRKKRTTTLKTLFDLCVSSLRRGHANLPCIVPILTDDAQMESKVVWESSRVSGGGGPKEGLEDLGTLE